MYACDSFKVFWAVVEHPAHKMKKVFPMRMVQNYNYQFCVNEKTVYGGYFGKQEVFGFCETYYKKQGYISPSFPCVEEKEERTIIIIIS